VITIDNRLAVPVRITFVNSLGQEGDLVANLPPGLEATLDVFPAGQDKCTAGQMMARDVTTGTELARSPNPVCRPSRWVISPGSPGSSVGAVNVVAAGVVHGTSLR